MTSEQTPVAVITGAGGGLGGALAERCRRDGSAIAAMDIDGDAAASAAAAVNAAGG